MQSSATPIPSNRTTDSPLRSTIGPISSNYIMRAVHEQRVVIGINPAIQYLNQPGADVLFGVLLASTESDVHMQNILMQAYLNEQKIDIIQVDSAEKMKRMLGTDQHEACVLILGANRPGKRSNGHCCERRASVMLSGGGCGCGQSAAKKLEMD